MIATLVVFALSYFFLGVTYTAATIRTVTWFNISISIAIWPVLMAHQVFKDYR